MPGARAQADRAGARQGCLRAPFRPRTDPAPRNGDRGLQLLLRRRRRWNFLRRQALHPRHQARSGRTGLRDPGRPRRADGHSNRRASAHRLEPVAERGEGDARVDP
jgi:hypothetical protein